MSYLLPTRLGALYDGGRDNNLNLLRVMAAIGVVVSHSYQITLGRDAVPGLIWILGSVSVWTFFVISGFLISASFERSSSKLRFWVSRCLRIFPALIVCILATGLIMGPLITARSLPEYFADPQVYNFIFGNISLFWETRPLPGVFSEHPVDHAQITFWSLKHEMLCYLGVLIFGAMGIYSTKGRFALFAAAFLTLWTLLLQVELNAADQLPSAVFSFRRVSIFFILGMISYVYRDYLYLSGAIALALVPTTIMLWWTPAYHIVLPLAVAYCALWFAFVPKGPMLTYNQVGDYSYGIYIFGVPIQQLVYHFVGDHSPWQNFWLALLPTLLLAMLSWRFIEKPALGARDGVTNWVVRQSTTTAKATTIPK